MKNDINKIILLSMEKKSSLDKMLNLTENQQKAIEEEDLDLIGTILEDKEKLIIKIDKIDIQFIELYNSIKEKEGISSFDEIDVKKYDNIKNLKNIVSEINNILRKISNIDKENTKKMKLSITNIKLDIKNVKKGKEAYKGYNHESVESILIDEKK